MIPQYIAAKLVKAPVAGILVGVYDENYKIADWRIEEDVDAARIAASQLADEYRVPIAKLTQRLLNI